MKKRRVKRRLKVGRLVLVIVLGIGLAISTYFGIKYLLKSSNDKPINKPGTYVMSKEEFVTRLTADLAARKKQRIALAKKRENESKSYIVDKMIYNRKKRNRR